MSLAVSLALVLAEPLVGPGPGDAFEGKEVNLLRSVGDVLLHEFVSEMASVKNPFYKSAVDRSTRMASAGRTQGAPMISIHAGADCPHVLC